MSQQNVELVRRWFQLFDRGEMEAALQHVDPAIETIEGAELPGARAISVMPGSLRPTTIGRANGITSAWN
jgi:hypothetical protein